MDRIKVFVNEEAVLVTPGTTVGAAVQRFRESSGAARNVGVGYLTDGVGRQLQPDAIVAPGMIIRAIAGRAPTE